MSSSLIPSRWDSLVHRILVKSCKKRDRFWVRKWWWWLNNRYMAKNSVVATTIHNRPAILNFGYTYPFTARLHPTFNDPLLQLVNQVFLKRGRPVRFVDVGAAVGDTVLLVHANCVGMVSEYVCVDGDREFFGYLESNLRFLPSAKLILHQLARSEGFDPALVRTHSGTASAQGKTLAPTAPLEHLLAERAIGPVDVLKIDVDGFDGEVLAGSEALLKRDRPGIVFEFHPSLCERTGNDWRAGFTALRNSGYSMTAWFTKVGTFSHYCSLSDDAAITRMEQFCRKTCQYDWHYDVVALPDGEDWDWLQLADLQFGRSRCSPC